MADYLDHSARWQHHRQPRDRRTIDPATGVNAGPPSDRDGADDAPDEAKGPSTPAPVAVSAERAYLTRLAELTDRHPLTPADPHDHDWDYSNTPGVDICTTCGDFRDWPKGMD